MGRRGRGDRDVFHAEFDPAADDVVAVVASAVAAVLDRSTTSVVPLGVVVDPDLLVSMPRLASTAPDQRGAFAFRYEGFEVTVETTGHVWLERV